MKLHLAFASVIFVLFVSFGTAGYFGYTILAPRIINNTSQPTEQQNDQSVLAASSTTRQPINAKLIFNYPSEFSQGLTVNGDSNFNGNVYIKNKGLNLGSGSLTAANILYTIKAGSGITSSGGQNPTITNSGVLSLQGSTGALTFTQGSGISISGLTIANSDTGSSQNIFKTITSGGTSFSAGSNSDTLTINAGSGISISSDTSNKKLTLTDSFAPSSFTANGVLYANSTSSFTSLSPGTSGYVLQSNGTGLAPSWVASTSLSASYWQLNSGALSPTNISNDLLIGGTATSSAKFQVLGTDGSIKVGIGDVNGLATGIYFNNNLTFVDNPSNYTKILPDSGLLLLYDAVNNEKLQIDGSNSSNALQLFQNGTVSQVTASSTLTSSILALQPNSGGVGIGTGTNTLSGTLDVRANSGTLAVASISGQTSFAGLVVDNSGKGDLFTASSSGLNRFVINQNGNVGIGTTNPSSFILQTAGNIGPNVTDTYNLGSSSLEWNNLYVKNLITSASSGQNGFWQLNSGVLSPATQTNTLSIGATGSLGTLDVRSLNGTEPTASISGATSFAGLVVDNSGAGDLFTASSSGQNRFVITQAGNVGIGTTTPAYGLDVNQKTAAFNSGQDGSIGSWSTSTNSLPTAAAAGSTVEANGYVYYIGGNTAGGVVATVNYAKLNADGSTGNWIPTTALPQTLRFNSSVVNNGYVYVFGGRNNAGSSQSTVYYAKLNANGTIGTWITNSNALPFTREMSAAVAANGYAYVIAGSLSAGNQRNTVYYAKFNPDGSLGAWNSANNLAQNLQEPMAVVANGFLYVLGGFNGVSASSSVYYAKLNSDGSTGAWLNANSMPTARSAGASLVADGYIYWLTGDDGTNDQTTIYYAKLNSDGSVGTWNTNATPVLAARDFTSAVTANGYFYVIGGGPQGGNFSTTVYYASTARVSIAGNLDLIGLTGQSLASASASGGGLGSAGGSIYAGNIFSNGNLEVTGNTQLFGSAGINGNLSLQGQINISSAIGTVPIASLSGTTSLAGLVVDNSGTGDLFTASSSGLSRFVITQNGNIGVGTTTPGYTLVAAGSGGNISLDTSASSPVLRLSRNGTNSIGADQVSGNLQFYTGGLNTPRLYIDNGGNIGIGPNNTSPLATLDIRANSGTISVASISGKTSFASLVDDNSGVGDLFTASSSGLNRFVITQNGNVGIGTTTPGDKLEIDNGGIKWGTSGQTFDWASGATDNTIIWKLPGTSACANGSPKGIIIQNNAGTQVGHTCITAGGNLVYWANAFTASSTDLAENYSDKNNVLEPGDVVSLDATVNKGVQKTTFNGGNVIGIISTQPGFLLTDISEDGGKTDLIHPKPVALSGRVPTKVSTINGPIAVGDMLTASSIPGVAMKATKSGWTIGRALENYTDSDPQAVGKILVFVNLSWFDPSIQLTDSGNLSVNGQPLSTTSFNLAVNNQPSTGIIATTSQQNAGTENGITPDTFNSLSATVSQLQTETASLSAQIGKIADLSKQLAQVQQQINLNQALASSSAMQAVLGVATEDATVSGSLSVLGRTVLSDLGVTGAIDTGLLSINGMDTSTGTASATINTLSTLLKVQSLAQAGVDFENGKVTIDTSGNIQIHAAMTVQKYDVDTSNTASASLGTVTISQGTTNVVVQTTAVTGGSKIFVTASSPVNIGVSNKIAGKSFSITLDKPATQSIFVDWWIVN
ncbi:MAG TPA: hypothetical protein VGT05_04330 [Patescibacteria group bacterium]|nr:hypothetical protein [Patescibacteria group bacterium]